jgi:hypothetical protein
MHRMNIEAQMILSGVNPVYYFDATVNNGDGSFGNWATLYHEEALNGAGLVFSEISKSKPYPTNWDGTPETLVGEAANLRNFISTNSTHWFINLVNGGDGDLPPCGAVDPTDPNSLVRCEIVPEMNTGDSLQVIGEVSNRTNDPWDADPVALQVDVDGNGQFLGAGETAYTQRPVMNNGVAEFDYNWSWYSQYGSGTYGMRVDFTNSAYYFTGNSSTLSATGAYINVTVVGTTDFQTTSLPRLYRNSSTTIQAKLVDNSLQPVRNAAVNYTWSADGRSGVNYTDDNGFFEVPFNISAQDPLGKYSLQFEFAGTPLLKGNTMVQEVWVVSRTYLSVVSVDPNLRQSGDRWDFTAQVVDDNKTSIRDSGGAALDGASSGLVDVIFEGSDFNGVFHRQVVATLAPAAGLISLLTVDDQIVYTSEINPVTGEVVPKPMVVTGQLQDELGTNLTNRNIRVSYEMINGQSNPTSCQAGMTDMDGRYSILCPLSDVLAGKAKVSVTYSSYDNNDAYRYENKTVQTEFDVFSNSTLAITEVGPFKSSVESWTAPNGSNYPVLYLKESFHLDAKLTQSNGQFVGGKCLNIYLDPDQNIRPVSTIRTSEIDGTIEWFSGDPSQNPTLKGVETTGGKLEGFRTLRLAFEPDVNVPGGCDKDSSNVLNGSFVDMDILVRSRIDLQVKQTWSHLAGNGLDNGEAVIGSVALLRDRLDLAVENEEVWFVRQYWSEADAQWVIEGTNKSKTNEQGVAEFEWAFAGTTCDGEPCDGQWRIIAYYPGSTYFAESQDNITHELVYEIRTSIDAQSGFFTPARGMALGVLLMALLIGGLIYYQRAQERRQVQALKGILTDTMMQLEASNEYIAAIFDCYKSLVKHFKRYGFMKKVYETTREFESAVRSAFNMVPAEQLSDFLSIFEEARYSDHTIDASHRDRALQTLQTIVSSLTVALGEEGSVSRKELVGLYDKQTKAGEFVAADGTVRQAGIVEGEGSDFKI